MELDVEQRRKRRPRARACPTGDGALAFSIIHDIKENLGICRSQIKCKTNFGLFFVCLRFFDVDDF